MDTIRQRWVIAALAVGLLTVGTLAGCADSGGTGTPAASPGGSVTPAGSPSSSGAGSPSPSRAGKLTTTGPAVAGEITVTGQVEEGVEPGCTLLRTPDKLYLLLGGDRAAIGAGGRITVRGRLQPDLMSTCQQGTPLTVLEVHKA